MAHLIDKDALEAEIESKRNVCKKVVLDLRTEENKDYYQGKAEAYKEALDLLDTLEVKEVDIDKLCEFRENIGFAYPEGASEYKKQLACYRQGIKDVIKAQKGEEV